MALCSRIRGGTCVVCYIRVDCSEDVSGIDKVPDLGFEHDGSLVVDPRGRRGAPSPEGNARPADGVAVYPRNISRLENSEMSGSID